MKIYLPGGAEADIIRNTTGGVDVKVVFPPKTYNSDEEYLNDKYSKIYNALMALKERVPELRGEISQNQMYSVKNAIDKHPVHSGTKAANGKDGHKKKGKANRTKAKTSPGIPPPDQKVIKTPAGGYLTIPEAANVEIFDKPEIETTGNAKAKVGTDAVKDFTVGDKRYVAGFDKTGKFTGYYLSTDMETKFVPEPIIYQSKVDDKFLNKLLEITYKLGQDPNKLMAVMAEETGETFNPTTKGKYGAVGLTQLTGIAIKQINDENKTNYTKEEILKMTAEEQLGLVEKYYNQRSLRNKTLKTIEDYALANFAPAAVGKGPNNVIYTKNTTVKSKIRAYNENASLDVDKNGDITNAEAGARYRAKYVEK